MAKQDKWEKVSALQRIEREGKKTPLDFMLAVMWSKNAPADLRLDAAKAAAPYVHSKMPLAITHTGEITVVQPFIPTREQLAEDFQDELTEG